MIKKLKLINGQSIIEFALILPLLLIIIFGIVDVGRLINTKLILNDVAKEASRMVAIGNTVADISQRISNIIQPTTGVLSSSNSIDFDDEKNRCTKITLSPREGNPVIIYITPVYSNTLKMGSTIRVYIKYEMTYITPLWSVLGKNASIKAVYYTNLEVPPK